MSDAPEDKTGPTSDAATADKATTTAPKKSRTPAKAASNTAEAGAGPDATQDTAASTDQDELAALLNARLPIGPMPSAPGKALDDWLELVRAQFELRKLADEYARSAAERAQADMELEKERLAMDKDRIEHEEALRREAEELASADHQCIYTFDDSVTDESVAEAMEQIGMWARRDPEATITVIINSEGGSVFAGLALYDQLQQLRRQGHKVITHALGMAASMGGILLQAGDERLIGENAYVLIHEVSSGAFGTTSTLGDELALTKRLQDQLLGILAERSTLTASQIARKWARRDWWLSGAEAVALGFADRVV